MDLLTQAVEGEGLAELRGAVITLVQPLLLRGLPWWLSWYRIPGAMRETRVQSLGWEDPLEKGKAIHSSILAWRIPWTI